jgi:argonaute-like protein implicated in RNA metabolism and viral defense
MKETVKLNLFEIKEELIPEKVFCFEVKCKNETEEEFRKKIFKLGVPQNLNGDTVKIFSLEKPKSETENLKEVPFSELREDIQEKLLKRLLKQKGVLQKLARAAQEIKTESRERIFTVEDSGFRVVKVENRFFASVELKVIVKSTKNLLQILKESSLDLEKVIGKEFFYSPPNESKGKNKRVFIVEVVKNPIKEEREKLKQYLKGREKEVEEAPFILKGCYGKSVRINKLYSFLPQDLYRIKPNQALSISNKERLLKTLSIVSNVKELHNFPLEKEFSKLKKPNYIVKDSKGTEVEVSSLTETLKYQPYELPSYLEVQERIPIALIYDERIDEKEFNSFILEQIKTSNLKLNRAGIEVFETIKNKDKGTLGFKARFTKDGFILPDTLEEKLSNYEISFLFCVTKEEIDEEFYNFLKGSLLEDGIVSQVVNYEKWKGKGSSFISTNLVFNAYAKLGIKPFILSKPLPYDAIVGIDVGNDPFGNRSVAGGITVFSPRGTVKGLYPLKLGTAGEKIDLIDVAVRKVIKKHGLKKGKLLLIKDGKLFKEELKKLSELPTLRINQVEVFACNLKKNHSLRLYTDYGEKAVKLKTNLSTSLFHSFKGARPVTVDAFYKVTFGEKPKEIPVSDNLMETLYTLSKLNFSSPFKEESKLRLPAPTHYADLYVKSLKRNWDPPEALVKSGGLYFL